MFLLALAPFLAFAQSSKLQVWTDAEMKFTADGKTVTYMTVYEKILMSTTRHLIWSSPYLAVSALTW